MERKHEGHYVKKLNDAGVKNVVNLLSLAFSPEKAGDGFITFLGSEQLKPLYCIGNYCKRRLNHNSISSYSQGKSFVASTNQSLEDSVREDREFCYIRISQDELIF